MKSKKYNIWLQNAVEWKYQVAERGNSQVKYKHLKISLK